MKLDTLGLLALCLSCASVSRAHDTWLQTNVGVIRAGDSVYIEYLLGNHGNDHRDFKIAGKPTVDTSEVAVIGPDGKGFDLKPSLIDLGYAPKEGFWAAQFAPVKTGLYLVSQKADQIAAHGGGPERIIRSAKAFFLVSASLDKVPADAPGFDRVLGHALELVPEANPIAPMGPGIAIKVRLLYQGKPLAGEKISFIPRGQALAEGFDAQYERKTDAAGSASFEPKEGNYFLVVAHHLDAQAKGKGYDATEYSATLCVIVPALCPCCGE